MSLQLIIGPMFSGKTSELFRRLRRARIAGQKIVLLRWLRDTRYGREALVHSHDPDNTMPGYPVKGFDDADKYLINEDTDVIGIDEGQFFGDELYAMVRKWVTEQGKTVIISALDSTAMQKPFETITSLVAQAEQVDKLHAVCILCKNPAAFSRKISGDVLKTIDVGGADKYIPSCRKCLNAPLSSEILEQYRSLF